MQGRKAQVASFGELNAVLHRFAISNLANQDDVRRLAQSVLQRVVPALRIDTDLALRNDAALVRMDVLDRILDRNDVAAGIFVAVSDHCRQRRRLTRARTADDDDDDRACS